VCSLANRLHSAEGGCELGELNSGADCVLAGMSGARPESGEVAGAALLYAVAQRDVTRVKMLLEQGVDPAFADYDKRTAAHLAASVDSVPILELLHEYGTDFNVKDRFMGTPMDDAIQERAESARSWLEKMGVKPGSRNRFTNDEFVKVEKEEEPARAKDPDSSVFKLLNSAALGDLREVQRITKKRPECINQADFDSRTALHVSAAEGQLKVVKYLLDAGALVNPRDRYGHSPLDDALKGEFNEVIEALRAAGGEETGAYSTEANVGQDELKLLKKRGEEEKWALDIGEIHLEEKPFARGAGGELLFAKWRGLKVVAKSCINMLSNKQALIDLGNEISLLSTLRHPHLILFLGASFEQDGPPLLILEYAAGGTLEERIIRAASEGKSLSKKERNKYTLELALAMNFLHLCDPPVIHRDLKPSNILIDLSGNLKVTDFGLAKFIASKRKKQGDKFTMTGETGSMRYMAGEVWKHEQYNEMVDVYSYSLIVYWMSTGVRPFVNYPDPVAAVKAAAVDGVRPPFGKTFEPKLKDLLMECWDANPDKRPSFQVIIDRLEEMGYRSVPLNHNEKCVVS